MTNLNSPKDDYCTTREAAQMLGLSLGTVQQMVESGLLKGWKTSGGHRRVSIESVEKSLRQRGAALSVRPVTGTALRVLIAEDDADLQRLYTVTIGTWGMPLSVQVVGNGFDGLMQIGLNPPDVLITDLMMPGLDGFEMIRRLRANSALNDMDIIAISALSRDDVDERGGLPADVTLYGKPVPFQELRGYLQAKLAQRQRSSSADSHS
jgi:excisionase family DNA binding protein